MKYLIGANFKMYKSHKDLQEYFDQFVNNYACFVNIDLMIAPMTVCLGTASEMTKDSCVHLGAQNMHYEDQGAYTGETSPLILKELGAEYVIIGHSERRQYFGETNQMINKKLKSALQHGIRPILCIGENLEQKELGISKETLKIQLREALQGIDTLDQIDVAYEPVRAIGTGKSATPEEVQDIHEYIRSVLGNEKSRIIYGGSVNDTNADILIAQPAVNGFLIGSASLDPQKFLKILDVVSKKNK
ncbi:Triosephosphate isomerase [candidate division SR1 bacterium RAAC1_SR1_1]|uniref:Triosephosphate isomerase n=2 Tax=candidate division SR1 bacterium RAAC1_SR1_1 TaxID=1394709 RepID=A0ACD6B8Q1_9BACT|nr:Triosephosphate isomerase [candidate division SR1 bacterium RAAC1_SR1_1]